MSDDFFDEDGLLDDDPALDYILYEEMEKDQKTPQTNGGCFGMIVILLIPVAAGIFFVSL